MFKLRNKSEKGELLRRFQETRHANSLLTCGSYRNTSQQLSIIDTAVFKPHSAGKNFQMKLYGLSEVFSSGVMVLVP